MDIIKLLRESTTSDLDAFILGELAADMIEQLREALLDIASFVPRAEGFWLKKATIDTLRGIPDGSH
jgi:hypothetical protein